LRIIIIIFSLRLRPAPLINGVVVMSRDGVYASLFVSLFRCLLP
jgi:hypothetical protein